MKTSKWLTFKALLLLLKATSGSKTCSSTPQQYGHGDDGEGGKISNGLDSRRVDVVVVVDDRATRMQTNNCNTVLGVAVEHGLAIIITKWTMALGRQLETTTFKNCRATPYEQNLYLILRAKKRARKNNAIQADIRPKYAHFIPPSPKRSFYSCLLLQNTHYQYGLSLPHVDKFTMFL